MKRSHLILVCGAIAGLALSGCTGDTSTSPSLSKSDVEAGISRRLAEIDKMNVPEAAKERMRQQARGNAPATEAEKRAESAKNNAKK